MHETWGYVFQCEERNYLPSFFLLVGDHWFEILPRDYAVQITESGICAFCLNSNDSYNGYWILGVTFMRHYYNIHDHANNRFGFASYVDSPKVNPVPMGAVPTALISESSQHHDQKEIDIKTSTALIVGISLCGGAILGILIYFCVRCAKDNKDKEQGNPAEGDTTNAHPFVTPGMDTVSGTNMLAKIESE